MIDFGENTDAYEYFNEHANKANSLLKFAPKKPLYFHISTDPHLDEHELKPRIPSYLTDKKNQLNPDYPEEKDTKRICVSPSINGCLQAILNMEKVLMVNDTTFYVYTPEKPFDEYKHKTNKELINERLVFDANVTKEAWILEPCKMKLYGVLRINKIRNKRNKDTINKGIKLDTLDIDWEWVVHPKVFKEYAEDDDFFMDSSESIQEAVLSTKERNELKDSDFGIPELRKYPLTDEEHVRKANSFFKFAPKKYKAELAKRILNAAKKFDIDTENWQLHEYLSKHDTIQESAELHGDAIEICHKIYDFWNGCTYGIRVGDKLITPDTDPEWESHYRFLSYDEFVETKTGICWDYTNYARHVFLKNHIPFKQYFMMCEVPGYMTHTFVLCDYEDDQVVLVESAFKEIDDMIGGIKVFDNFREATRFIASMMFSLDSISSKVSSFKYDVIEFHGHPQYHSTGKEYVEWMYERDENEVVYQSTATIEEYHKFKEEMSAGKHMYFYHLLPNDVHLDSKGLKTPEYVYKVEGNRSLYLQMVDKYRNRLCNGWGIYPDRDPESLAPKEIYDGINKFRQDPDGNNRIYMFRYPPTPDLGPNMKKTLDGKTIYAFDILNPKNKEYIKSIHWGFKDSHTDNEALTREYYEDITPEEYFANYDDDSPMLFASLSHISITPSKGYIPKSRLKETDHMIPEKHNKKGDKLMKTEQIQEFTSPIDNIKENITGESDLFKHILKVGLSNKGILQESLKQIEKQNLKPVMFIGFMNPENVNRTDLKHLQKHVVYAADNDTVYTSFFNSFSRRNEISNIASSLDTMLSDFDKRAVKEEHIPPHMKDCMITLKSEDGQRTVHSRGNIPMKFIFNDSFYMNAYYAYFAMYEAMEFCESQLYKDISKTILSKFDGDESKFDFEDIEVVQETYGSAKINMRFRYDNEPYIIVIPVISLMTKPCELFHEGARDEVSDEMNNEQEMTPQMESVMEIINMMNKYSDIPEYVQESAESSDPLQDVLDNCKAFSPGFATGKNAPDTTELINMGYEYLQNKNAADGIKKINFNFHVTNRNTAFCECLARIGDGEIEILAYPSSQFHNLEMKAKTFDELANEILPQLIANTNYYPDDDFTPDISYDVIDFTDKDDSYPGGESIHHGTVHVDVDKAGIKIHDTPAEDTKPYQEMAENGLIKVNNIKHNIMYFGSDIDFGENSIKLNKPELFLTPFIGLASIFTTKRSRYGIPPGLKDINLAYEEWYSPELDKPFDEIHVTVEGCPELNERKFEATGYIYAIDISEYKDNIYQKDWMDSNKEFLLCDVPLVPIRMKIEHPHIVYVKGADRREISDTDDNCFYTNFHVPITKENAEKYKTSGNAGLTVGLQHLRVNPNVKGFIWPTKNDDEVIAYVAVERKPEGMFIIALEIAKRYQGKGFGKKLLTFAEKELEADHLTVNKKNDSAFKLYLDNGWEVYDETDHMYFMKKENEYKHHDEDNDDENTDLSSGLSDAVDELADTIKSALEEESYSENVGLMTQFIQETDKPYDEYLKKHNYDSASNTIEIDGKRYPAGNKTSNKYRNRINKFLRENDYDPETETIATDIKDHDTGKNKRVRFNINIDDGEYVGPGYSKYDGTKPDGEKQSISMSTKTISKKPNISNLIYKHEEGHANDFYNSKEFHKLKNEIEELEKQPQSKERDDLLAEKRNKFENIRSYYQKEITPIKSDYNHFVKTRQIIGSTATNEHASDPGEGYADYYGTKHNKYGDPSKNINSTLSSLENDQANKVKNKTRKELEEDPNKIVNLKRKIYGKSSAEIMPDRYMDDIGLTDKEKNAVKAIEDVMPDLTRAKQEKMSIDEKIQANNKVLNNPLLSPDRKEEIINNNATLQNNLEQLQAKRAPLAKQRDDALNDIGDTRDPIKHLANVNANMAINDNVKEARTRANFVNDQLAKEEPKTKQEMFSSFLRMQDEYIQEAGQVRNIQMAYYGKKEGLTVEQQKLVTDYGTLIDQLNTAGEFYKREKKAREKEGKRLQEEYARADDANREEIKERIVNINKELKDLAEDYMSDRSHITEEMNRLADEYDKTLATIKVRLNLNERTCYKS